MHKNKLSFSKLLTTLLILLSSTSAIADGKIIKWVDEKGVTHYGDKMPAQDSGRKNTVLNHQGVVLKENDPSKNTINPDDPVVIEQQRRDHALLASYNSESEIDLARDRNLQMDELAIQALVLRKESAKKKLESNQKIADGFKQRKKTMPVELTEDLNENRAEISKVDNLVLQRKQSMQETRKRFEGEKQRYIELRGSSPAANSQETAKSKP